MPQRHSSFAALDQLLSGVEELIMSAPDSELANVSKTQDVSQLIQRHLSPSVKRKIVKTKKGASLDERLAYLRKLLAMRGEAHALPSAVFSAGKKLSKEQIEDAISELMKKKKED